MRLFPITLLPVLLFSACDGLSPPPGECMEHEDCAGKVTLDSDCQMAQCIDHSCLAVDREAGVTCQTGQALGPCQEAFCDGAGRCVVDSVENGTACDDGDACTRSDSCQWGACESGELKSCLSDNPCELIDGQCDPVDGRCLFTPLEDGTACDDGREETVQDSCLAGFCRGLNEVDCPAPPACDADPPDPGPEDGWRHTSSSVTAALGAPYHRGRDLFLTPGDAQWALAKFTYVLGVDKDIHDEDVDMWLLRGGSAWEYLGRARTSEDDEYPAVEGVEDTGGWIFYPIPEDRKLAPGRHRVHFVVRGDLSSTDQIIQVLEPGARVAVSDVDGTLTSDEYAQAWDVLLDISPDAHPGAAQAMWTLSRKGYHLFYLTARPSFLTDRTPAWLAERGFPPGIVHTTLSLTGATGDAAVQFKTRELLALGYRLGHSPDFAFGNKESDVEAYTTAGIAAGNCYYYALDGDPAGGSIHEDYASLAELFDSLPSSCLTLDP